MAKIDLVYSETLLESGISNYISWDTDKAAHMAVSGITGMGKTTLVKLICARINKYIPASEITVCDFKGIDFQFLNGCSRYYRFDACMDGFNEFYNSFISRQRNNESYTFRLLMFEEWASFLQYLDKKDAEEAKKKLSSLLMLSRAYNYHILLSQQRLSAESFGNSRDNLNIVITLGNLSKEVRDMLFSEYKEEIRPDRTIGSGYILTNGSDFRRIVVPYINNMKLVEENIRQAVER